MSYERTPGISFCNTHFLFRVTHLSHSKGDFEEQSTAINIAKKLEGATVHKYIPPDGAYNKQVYP